MQDAWLTEQIKTIDERSRGTYGSPRIHAELRAQGIRVAHKLVARLMGEAGSRGVSRRHGTWTTRRSEKASQAPDRVERDFAVNGLERVLGGGSPYVPTRVGFLFLAVVLDPWSLRVVEWVMASHLPTELVLDALEMALWQRWPEGVIHHSDQEWQYTSIAFGKRCRKAGVRPSVASVGDAHAATPHSTRGWVQQACAPLAKSGSSVSSKRQRGSPSQHLRTRKGWLQCCCLQA